MDVLSSCRSDINRQWLAPTPREGRPALAQAHEWGWVADGSGRLDRLGRVLRERSSGTSIIA